MPGTEDRTPAAGGGDAGALRSTIRLVDDLVDALVGQVRRAQRQSEAATALPRGTNEALAELGRDAARVADRSGAVLRALGAERKATKAPRVQPAEAAAAERGTPQDDAASSTEIVRSVAIDLRLQGHARDEVRRRLEQTFGADRAAQVVNEVFDR
jgi:hypothetical protein